MHNVCMLTQACLGVNSLLEYKTLQEKTKQNNIFNPSVLEYAT